MAKLVIESVPGTMPVYIMRALHDAGVVAPLVTALPDASDGKRLGSTAPSLKMSAPLAVTLSRAPPPRSVEPDPHVVVAPTGVNAPGGVDDAVRVSATVVAWMPTVSANAAGAMARPATPSAPVRARKRRRRTVVLAFIAPPRAGSPAATRAGHASDG